MYRYQTNGNKKNGEEKKASLQNESVITTIDESPAIPPR
jgi:hypothetical protein